MDGKDKEIERLRRENAELKKCVEERDIIIEEKSKKIEILESQLDESQRKLRVYDNPNTPPSQQRLKKKQEKESSNKKRGAPKGHNGTTREHKDPDETIQVESDKCIRCGSENIHELDEQGTDDKLIEDLPPIEEMRPKVIKFKRKVYECEDCKAKFTAEDKRCPKKGRFGVELMLFITLLKFLPRAVLRKITEFMDYTHDFKITASSVNEIISRAADASTGDYNKLRERIRKSQRIHVDETSFSVLGNTESKKKWWLWVFRTDTDILIVFNKSRGHFVLDEILGEDYSGIIICDGWSAYKYLKNAIIQRCWAHLLRVAKELREDIKGKELHNELKLMFEEIKLFRESNPIKEARRKKHEELTSRMDSLLKKYSGYKQLEKVTTYLENGKNDWFTCILYENVEPTNNNAEQTVREPVIVRKIIGAFRSENGAANYAKLASLLATWKLNNKNIKDELRSVIVNNLCLSS
jgi:transposase